MSTQEKETAVAIRMQDLSPQYAEIMVLGNVLQKSGYFRDVRDQAQAVTKILCGRELGFSPIVSMQGIHIIEGKPALSSNLMATLIKRSGKYDYRVKAWTNTECVLTFREKVDSKWEDVGESSFNMDDAKAAGVLRAGGSWSKYPKAMLFARALSQGLRTYCPDVSAAPIYNPEEMGAEVNEDGDVMSVRDLPKSSRPVEVIEHDIVIEPLKSAPGNSAQDTKPQKGIATDTVSQGAVPLQPLPPLDDLVKQAEAAMSAKPASLPEGCVDARQAANFHIEFKKALPAKLRKDAEAIAHDWLKRQGIVDGDGNGTAKAIRRGDGGLNFLQVRNAACEYAKTYQV